jgi:hypothetical protein
VQNHEFCKLKYKNQNNLRTISSSVVTTGNPENGYSCEDHHQENRNPQYGNFGKNNQIGNKNHQAMTQFWPTLRTSRSDSMVCPCIVSTTRFGVITSRTLSYFGWQVKTNTKKFTLINKEMRQTHLLWLFWKCEDNKEILHAMYGYVRDIGGGHIDLVVEVGKLIEGNVLVVDGVLGKSIAKPLGKHNRRH